MKQEAMHSRTAVWVVIKFVVRRLTGIGLLGIPLQYTYQTAALQLGHFAPKSAFGAHVTRLLVENETDPGPPGLRLSEAVRKELTALDTSGLLFVWLGPGPVPPGPGPDLLGAPAQPGARVRQGKARQAGGAAVVRGKPLPGGASGTRHFRQMQSEQRANSELREGFARVRALVACVVCLVLERASTKGVVGCRCLIGCRKAQRGRGAADKRARPGPDPGAATCYTWLPKKRSTWLFANQRRMRPGRLL
jgi:hypothetical protein